jgi:hypothetical protein
MWPFVSQPSQPMVDAEAVNAMLVLKADHLARVELLYKEAEEKFQEAILRFVRHRNNHRESNMVRLGDKLILRAHPTPDPELDRLGRDRWQAEFQRNELLVERWELRRDLGLSR